MNTFLKWPFKFTSIPTKSYHFHWVFSLTIPPILEVLVPNKEAIIQFLLLFQNIALIWFPSFKMLIIILILQNQTIVPMIVDTSYIDSTTAEIESLEYNESGLELKSTFVVNCLTFYPLIFTVILIFRMLSDNDSGRRAMLYLHNVSTGLYGCSLFLYSILLMTGVSVLCIFVGFAGNVIPSSQIFNFISCFIVGGISSATFSIFIGMLIHVKYIITSFMSTI